MRRVDELVTLQSRIYADRLAPALAAAGVVILDWGSLTASQRCELADQFHRLIFPTLTPLAVDGAHPFPYISNLSLNLLVNVAEPTTGVTRVARLKVPQALPRFMTLSDGPTFVPVEQVIAAHLDELFPSMDVGDWFTFRVTRNVDLSVDEGDAEDLLAAVELQLHRRRFGHAVRLEAGSGIPADVLAMLVAEMGVHEEHVWLVDVPLDLTGLSALPELHRRDLAPAPWTGVPPAGLAGSPDLFAVLDRRDLLVHHPYESYASSVEEFVDLAAEDDRVLAIKQTLYRAGESSPVIDSLDPRLAGWQAGDGGGRAPSPIRRAGQYRLGQSSRGGRRPSHLWDRQQEDPREDLSRGAARGR